MKLQLGTTLRQLRRDRDLTQEELAEMLNVSCQSVSRWENDVCYPDMELLPEIASFFETTVDQLLGVSRALEEKKVAEYLAEFQRNISVGKIDACIETARAGLREFPGNFALMNKLMYALFVSGDDTGNIPDWKENQAKYDREIVALGERIMKFCPDQDIRLEATVRLGFHHCSVGRRTQGRAILDSLPPMDWCRENWIWWGLEEDEKLPYTRKQISRGYSAMRAGFYNLATQGILPDREAVEVFGVLFAVDTLMWGGERSGASFGSAQIRCQWAAAHARLGEADKALGQLRLAASAARTFDSRPEEETVSSVIFGTRTARRTDFETADTRPCRRIMAEKWMADPSFDGLRGTEEFREVLASLEET